MKPAPDPTVEPLVGRAAELAQLTDVLARLRRGRGDLVAVVGEPGVGKSRLRAEFQARADDVTWLQLRCFSYEADHAYAPYADLLRRVDHPESPYFDSLLGESVVQGLEPEVFRRELQLSFRAWLRDLLGGGPVVLAVEDVHWLDASSLALTAQLAAMRDELPLLVFVTSREQDGRFLDELGTSALTLPLAPFDSSEVEAMVENLLEGARPPPELTAIVVERSGGNPFFAGELVRSLIEVGALRSEDDWKVDLARAGAAMPATIEGVLSARIDLLMPATAAILQRAAVIGRRVPVRLLSVLAENVESAVDDLVRLRFLDRLNDETVVFHHALVQEIAYGRILRRNRRELHGQVAEAVEALYGRGGAAVELLARHLYHAEAGLKAVRYLRLAGERARRMYANDEAVSQLEMALERLTGIEGGEFPAGLEAALQRELGEVLDLTGRHSEAEAAYRSSIAAEPELVLRAQTMALLGTVVKRVGQYAEAERVLDTAEAELGSPAAETDERWWAAWLDVADARFSLYYWLDDVRMEPLIERMRPRIETAGTPQQRIRFFSSLAMLGLRRDRFLPSDSTVEAAEAELAADSSSATSLDTSTLASAGSGGGSSTQQRSTSRLRSRLRSGPATRSCGLAVCCTWRSHSASVETSLVSQRSWPRVTWPTGSGISDLPKRIAPGLPGARGILGSPRDTGGRPSRTGRAASSLGPPRFSGRLAGRCSPSRGRAEMPRQRARRHRRCSILLCNRCPSPSRSRLPVVSSTVRSRWRGARVTSSP